MILRAVALIAVLALAADALVPCPPALRAAPVASHELGESGVPVVLAMCPCSCGHALPAAAVVGPHELGALPLECEASGEPPARGETPLRAVTAADVFFELERPPQLLS